MPRTGLPVPQPKRLRLFLTALLCSEDSERFVSPGTFSFVLSFLLARVVNWFTVRVLFYSNCWMHFSRQPEV